VNTRPVTLVIAPVLVAATGVAYSVGGLLLLALASGRLPFLGSTSGAGVLATTGVVSLVLAVVTWLAAVDLRRGHLRGWAASLITGFIAFDAALTAVLTGDISAPLLAALGLTSATVVALLASTTRREVGLLPGSSAAAI
jgi:hypothetical protein